MIITDDGDFFYPQYIEPKEKYYIVGNVFDIKRMCFIDRWLMAPQEEIYETDIDKFER